MGRHRGDIVITPERTVPPFALKKKRECLGVQYSSASVYSSPLFLLYITLTLRINPAVASTVAFAIALATAFQLKPTRKGSNQPILQ